MPEYHTVETHHFRQCFTTRCPARFIPAEVEHCPICGERAPYVGEAGKVSVKTVREQIEDGDWTHGLGYEKASKDDIGL